MIFCETKFSSTFSTLYRVGSSWASSPLRRAVLALISIARFAPHVEGHDGGPPPIQTRQHIRGIPNCPPQFRKSLREANVLVDRTCSILKAATEAGSEWALENPCDSGVPVAHGGRRDIYSDPRHGSIWQMPAVIEPAQHASCHTATFPLSLIHI